MRTSIIYFAATSIHSLQQLIHLFVAHLLPQIGQNIPQLANTNEARHVFIEYLEASAVFLRLARIAESAWSIENFGEGLEVNYPISQVSIVPPQVQLRDKDGPKNRAGSRKTYNQNRRSSPAP